MRADSGPSSIDLTLALTGDAGEQTEMALLVTSGQLADASDYVEQQVAARLRALNAQPALDALLQGYKVGTVYSLDPNQPAGTVLAVANG